MKLNNFSWNRLYDKIATHRTTTFTENNEADESIANWPNKNTPIMYQVMWEKPDEFLHTVQVFTHR